MINGGVNEKKRWRTKTSKESENLLKKETTVQCIKMRGWLGHVECTEDSRMPKKHHARKHVQSEEKRVTKEEVGHLQKDLKDMGMRNWMKANRDFN